MQKGGYEIGSGTPMGSDSQAIICRYDDTTPRYKSDAVKPFMAMGAVQLATGVLSLMVGIANVLVCGIMGVVGYGIWGGALVSSCILCCLLFY